MQALLAAKKSCADPGDKGRPCYAVCLCAQEGHLEIQPRGVWRCRDQAFQGGNDVYRLLIDVLLSGREGLHQPHYITDAIGYPEEA